MVVRDEAARRRAIRMQRGVLWLSRHWLWLVALFFGLYVGLALLAPVLMHVGATGPARALYTIYSPLCHQFAFRSWFLFGAQPAYPRADAGVAGLEPYESFVAQDEFFAAVPDLHAWTADLQLLSRSFIGNPVMGYKVALCERDIAIYGALFLFTLLFALIRNRLRPAPLWLYLVLGLGPIGLDGFSQLLSQPPLSLWPARESTPLFRTVTGALFGLMNGWLALPYLEESMRETRRELVTKLRRIGAL
ncbi:MAG: DUF2085 domain-containing protein [Anaerolineae bacterium]|nr:DUF2085 domain-containing protein [Anaerolineae bacterium]